jgi:hypothetical protein
VFPRHWTCSGEQYSQAVRRATTISWCERRRPWSGLMDRRSRRADTRSGQRSHWLAAMHVAVRESAAALQQHAAPCMLQRERTRLRCLWPCHVAFVCCGPRWNARRVLQWVSEPAAAALATVADCFSSSRPPPLERLGFGLREALVDVVPQQLRGATRAS